jgi:DNA-binding CsgD family transcriptional regulator
LGAIANPAIVGAVAKATLDSLEYAAIACNDAGEVLVANHAAHDLLEQCDGLALKEGRVCALAPESRARLLAMLAGGKATPPAGGATVLLVPRPSGLASYQIILREIDGQSMASMNRSERLWTMIISDPARPSSQAVRTLSYLYNLTSAEARIAAALAAGERPHEIAGRTGVKIATIRSQLASIYAKTGTRRQSELVRLLSAMPPIR